MRCPKCNGIRTGVKTTRGPDSLKCHIPAVVRAAVADRVGAVAPFGWVVRWRVCRGCAYTWWTLEASIKTINQVVNDVQ